MPFVCIFTMVNAILEPPQRPTGYLANETVERRAQESPGASKEVLCMHFYDIFYVPAGICMHIYDICYVHSIVRHAPACIFTI